MWHEILIWGVHFNLRICDFLCLGGTNFCDQEDRLVFLAVNKLMQFSELKFRRKLSLTILSFLLNTCNGHGYIFSNNATMCLPYTTIKTIAFLNLSFDYHNIFSH